MINLPPDHDERALLANEVHARPYEPLEPPVRATYVAVLVAHDARRAEFERIVELCRQCGAEPPTEQVIQHSFAIGSGRLKWERHGEFSSYTIYLPGDSAGEQPGQALTVLPAGWLAAVPGKTVVAAHAELRPAAAEPPDAGVLAAFFNNNITVGSEIGDGAGLAYTDFRIHADGYSRFLVLSRALTPREAGRTLQRLFEIEAYRMMALLALPIARRLGAQTVQIENSLTVLTDSIAREGVDDERLLGELTQLAAQVEHALAATQFRFGASRAYHDLVRTRIAELRERRLAGAQTINGFMNRRFTPAMATCSAVSQRLHELSERVAQASGLLSTRVNIVREKQSQALLASMDRRARLQLRLQQTVEGLSVAAITYYGVGLVGYAAKALKSAGMPINPEWAMGLAIPVVGISVAWAVRRARRHIEVAESAPH